MFKEHFSFWLVGYFPPSCYFEKVLLVILMVEYNFFMKVVLYLVWNDHQFLLKRMQYSSINLVIYLIVLLADWPTIYKRNKSTNKICYEQHISRTRKCNYNLLSNKWGVGMHWYHTLNNYVWNLQEENMFNVIILVR